MPIARGLNLTRRDHVRARLAAMGVDCEGFDRRLARLTDTGSLYARTGTAWVENLKFRPDVILRVLAQAEQVVSLSGAPIDLPGRCGKRSPVPSQHPGTSRAGRAAYLW